MAKFKSNIGEFVAHLSAMQKATSPERVSAIVRGKVISIFKEVVEETPQWSGAAASLWAINFSGSGKPSGYMAVPESEAKSKGDSAAVAEAYAGSAWFNTAGPLVLTGDLAFVNPQPYIGQLEAGTKLRAVNAPGRMIQRALERASGVETIGWVKMRYESYKL